MSTSTTTALDERTQMDHWETAHTCVKQAAAICSLIATHVQTGTGETLPLAAWAAEDLLIRAEEALECLWPEAQGNGMPACLARALGVAAEAAEHALRRPPVERRPVPAADAGTGALPPSSERVLRAMDVAVNDVANPAQADEQMGVRFGVQVGAQPGLQGGAQ